MSPSPVLAYPCPRLQGGRTPRAVVLMGLATLGLAWSGCRGPTGEPMPPVVDEEVLAPQPPAGARALTAVELRNTVAEVFGGRLADDLWLPHDALLHGFDNQTAAAPMTSSRLVWLDEALQTVIERAVRPPQPWAPLEGAAAEGESIVRVEEGSSPVLLGWLGRIQVPVDGRYRVDFQGGLASMSALDRAVLGIDSAPRTEAVWDPVSARFESMEVEISAGLHEIAMWQAQVENVGVTSFSEVGPVLVTGPINPPAEVPRAVMPCAPSAPECVDTVLRELLPVAWRRPLSIADRGALLALADKTRILGGSNEDVLSDVLAAALLDPRFLLHVGGDDDWGLAERLSYALWSAPPDAALRAHAEAGDLRRADVLAAEVHRMLADPKAEGLLETFVGEWLELHRLRDLIPSTDVHPGWTREVGEAMQDQVLQVLRPLFLEGGDLRDLVDLTHAPTDPLLAAWIGTEAGASVDLSRDGRYGILGLPGIQTMLAHTDTTAPSRRGAWILDHLLCIDPGTPPATVTALPETEEDKLLPIGARLARHADDPACSGCHVLMDPLGLAMEGFGAAGQARTADTFGVPVDTTGALPDGTVVHGLAELTSWIAQDPRFSRCIVEKAFTWMVGRPPMAADGPRLEALHGTWQTRGSTFEALAVALANDPAFRAGPAAEGAP
jgi:hypothetical protein